RAYCMVVLLVNPAFGCNVRQSDDLPGYTNQITIAGFRRIKRLDLIHIAWPRIFAIIYRCSTTQYKRIGGYIGDLFHGPGEFRSRAYCMGVLLVNPAFGCNVRQSDDLPGYTNQITIAGFRRIKRLDLIHIAWPRIFAIIYRCSTTQYKRIGGYIGDLFSVAVEFQSAGICNLAYL